MHRKHYLWVALLSLWGIVFYLMAETMPDELLPVFRTSWLEGLKALIVGISLGGLFRIAKIKNYLVESVVGGETFLRVGFGVLGLGMIGMGVVGAALVYSKHENLELILVPLNATVVGLAVTAIHVVMNWKRNEI